MKKHLSIPTISVETISTTDFLRQELSPALEQSFFLCACEYYILVKVALFSNWPMFEDKILATILIDILSGITMTMLDMKLLMSVTLGNYKM